MEFQVECLLSNQRTQICDANLRLVHQFYWFLSNLFQTRFLIIDFYMQEINREANTLSSKSKDFAISDYSIEIKKNVNQVREIAANLD